MMKKIVFGGILLVIVTSLAIYAWLGGFQSAVITETDQPSRIVYGTSYQGKYGDLKLREIVVTTKQWLSENEVAGWMVVVNYDSLSASQEINQLIGIAAPESLRQIPDSLATDTLTAGKYLRIKLYGHPVVRLTPEQSNQKANKYAEQQQLRLGNKVIEYYFGTDSMWVEYPIELQ